MKYLPYVGLLIFLYIISTLDFESLYINIQNINFWYLLIAFFLNMPMVYLKSCRWKKILDEQNINITSSKCFSFYMASLYLGFITPGRVGEVSRVLYVKTLYEDKNYGSLFSTIVLDRLFDLYLLVVLTIIAFLSLSLDVEPIFIFMFFVLFFVLPYVVIKFNIFKHLLTFISKKFSKKFHESISEFRNSFNTSFQTALTVKNMSLFTFLTCASYLIFFAQAYLISLSLGMNINFIIITLIMAISNTISLLPISISGIGTRDMVLLYFLVPLGVSSEVGVLFSTLILLVFFAGCSVLGFFHFLKEPIDLKNFLVKRNM